MLACSTSRSDRDAWRTMQKLCDRQRGSAAAHGGVPHQPSGGENWITPIRAREPEWRTTAIGTVTALHDSRGVTNRRVTTETKAAVKTTELVAFVARGMHRAANSST